MKSAFTFIFALIMIVSTQATLAAEETVITNFSFVKAKFKQTRTLPGIKQGIASEGAVYFYQGKGLIWKTTSPYQSTILINSKGVFQLSNSLEIDEDDSDDSFIFMEMVKIFSAIISNDLSVLKEYFQIKSAALNKQQMQHELKPVNSDMANYVSLVKVIAGRHIERVELIEANGSVTQTIYKTVTESMQSLSSHERKMVEML